MEPQIRSQLGGFLGGIVRAYLPQTWVFKTEKEVVSYTVDRTGAVSVTSGVAKDPDVTIEARHDHLVTLLQRRSRAGASPGSVVATPHTPKGKTAFDYLRGRLGL